jgi:hypothetical protein
MVSNLYNHYHGHTPSRALRFYAQCAQEICNNSTECFTVKPWFQVTFEDAYHSKNTGKTVAKLVYSKASLTEGVTVNRWSIYYIGVRFYTTYHTWIY